MLYALARRWPLLVVVGGVTSTIGVGLILQPLAAVKAALLVFGVVALLLGITACFIPRRPGEGIDVALGACLCVIAGMVSLVGALLPVVVLAYVMAAQCFVAVIAQVVSAVELRATPLLAAALVLCAMASLALGIASLLAPTATLVALLALCGACCCACGLLLLAFAAWSMRAMVV